MKLPIFRRAKGIWLRSDHRFARRMEPAAADHMIQEEPCDFYSVT
jgi:hypothetical protein